jgi:plastocyanin
VSTPFLSFPARRKRAGLALDEPLGPGNDPEIRIRALLEHREILEQMAIGVTEVESSGRHPTDHARLCRLVLFAPAAGAQGKTTTVSIKNFAFSPANITVAPGTTVTWVNNDQTAHTATATDPAGTFDSGAVQPGQSYSFTFDKPGTYTYHCEIHPDMTGTVTVSGAGASSTATSPTARATTNPGSQLPSSGGPSFLGPVAAVALVAFGAIALGLVLARRAAS